MKCSNCGKESRLVKGLCAGSCYQLMRKYGTPNKKKVPNQDPCSVCGIIPVAARGLCKKHYQRYLRHGHTNVTRPEKWGYSEKHPLYRLWCGMRRRCNDHNSKDYGRYGGRGVKVCEQWNNFWVFVQDVGERPSLQHSLERKDTNGNYEPENVTWANPKEQARNKRNNVINEEICKEIRRRLDYGDSVSAIAKALRLNYDTVYNVKSKDIWK